MLKYPVCSHYDNELLDLDLRSHPDDDKLTQLHAYLSCVWRSGGPDVVPAEQNIFFPYYNSRCADTYECVAIVKITQEHYHPDNKYIRSAYFFGGLMSMLDGPDNFFNLKNYYDSTLLGAFSSGRGGYDLGQKFSANNTVNFNAETVCGINIRALIDDRDEMGLTDMCSTTVKDPIDIMCPGVRISEQTVANHRGRAYSPAPNPCLPASGEYYDSLWKSAQQAYDKIWNAYYYDH